MPILTARLVAVARGSETVNATLLNLPFAIDGGQGILEASSAKTVRVAVNMRVSASPCFIASYALVHHKPFLSTIFAK